MEIVYAVESKGANEGVASAAWLTVHASKCASRKSAKVN
jgi:hypothetical protein